MAEISRGSRPSDFSLLNVSRQEIPASTRMRAFELSTMAVFPRLPLASTEMRTPMPRSIPLLDVEVGVTVWLSGILGPIARPFMGAEQFVNRLARHRPCIRTRNSGDESQARSPDLRVVGPLIHKHQHEQPRQ